MSADGVLWCFWAALALIGWTYVGFPLVLSARAMLFPKPVQSGAVTPKVSIIIAAHNEEEAITEKLRNTKQLDYPPDRLEVIVASDGSEDRTNELVANFGDPAVRLLPLPRLGKNPAVNAAVAEATGDVLVFTDADSMLKPDALRKLVAPFQDPQVGGVGGDYRYLADASDGSGERTYWSVDRVWKQLQSRAGSMTSATGQIYALRRDLYRELPQGVTDDFYCSIQAPAAGRRLVYAPDAVAYGPIAASLRMEYARKVRVMTRGLNGLWKMRRLLNPITFGFYSLQLLSHKLLRRLMAIPLACLFVSNAVLLNQGKLYVATFLLQAVLYSAASLGFFLIRTGFGRLGALGLPAYFVMVNIAGIVAASNLVLGRNYEVWVTGRAPIDRTTVTREPVPHQGRLGRSSGKWPTRSIRSGEADPAPRGDW